MSEPAVVFKAEAEFGRIQIFTDANEVTKENVIEIVRSAYLLHTLNAIKEEELFGYARGKQPIRDRVKEVRPEINEKLVINVASRILTTHVGYCFGNPITYVQRGKVEDDSREPLTTSDEENNYIAMLNKMMAEQHKANRDIQLARDFMTCGLGYQMVWRNDKQWQYSPFKIATLNPRTTFVVYKNDAFREPLLGCSYIIHQDGAVTFTAYSEKSCFVIEKFLSTDNSYQHLVETPNILGEIPIIEFEHEDRMGIFEKVIPILNGANVLNSDRLNDVSQHVQSLLWMHNCGLNDDNIDKLYKMGVIATKSNGEGKDAKITYLTQVLNQSEIQTFADFLIRQAEEITSTPSWQEASGGSTTGAMQLSNGWQSLELSAKAVEQSFQEPENKILRLATKIIELDKRKAHNIKNIDISDIETKFTRNKNYDLLSKTNSLATLINAGVDGLWAFQTVGLFSDAEQAYIDSKKTIDAVQKKITDTGSSNADKSEDGKGGENNEPNIKANESTQPSKMAQVED